MRHKLAFIALLFLVIVSLDARSQIRQDRGYDVFGGGAGQVGATVVIPREESAAMRLNSREDLSGWVPIGQVTTDNVTQCSISSDGSNLMVFYRHWAPSLSENQGYVKRWDGTLWTLLHADA